MTQTDSPAFADAVIVAAGSSRRMDGVDKLRADLGGQSVLERAARSMAAAQSVGGLVIVAAADAVNGIAAEPWARELGATVVAGGARRQESVAAGVAASSREVVLVHDGARPFASAHLADSVAMAARRFGAAIPVLPVVDALKQVQDGAGAQRRVTGSLSRSDVVRAQTPQGARRELLAPAAAALAGGAETFPDEAELLARYGVPVTTVSGEARNIKLTVPSDLELARAIVGASPAALRTGIGRDSHPFGPDSGLRLGGIEIAEAPRLFGHSDGDVALHALCDALLGAAGLGDLGRLFPATEEGTRGVSSVELLSGVRRRLRQRGFAPVSVDLTIVGARPRLGAQRLDTMRSRIARALQVDEASVSVKASTGNLSGEEGAGRAMSAFAIATVSVR